MDMEEFRFLPGLIPASTDFELHAPAFQKTLLLMRCDRLLSLAKLRDEADWRRIPRRTGTRFPAGLLLHLARTLRSRLAHLQCRRLQSPAHPPHRQPGEQAITCRSANPPVRIET